MVKEELLFYDAEDTLLATLQSTVIIDGTGIGSTATLNAGIFYMGGYFVTTMPQTVILDKYTSSPTYSVGISLFDSIVDASMDASLFDNANGSFNEGADGADRLKLTIVLDKKEIDDGIISSPEVQTTGNDELL